MLEEQKEREQKAFKVKVGDRPQVPYTIPKPFNLHQDYKSEIRKIKAMEEIRQREMKECTFQPRTNSASTRQIIDRILGDEDEALTEEALL